MFKVGDKIKLIKGFRCNVSTGTCFQGFNSECCPFNEEKLEVIALMPNNSFPIKAVLGSEHRICYFKEKECQLISLNQTFEEILNDQC